MSELVLLQPQGQDWWRGGEVPFRVVELNGKREVMVNVTAMLAGVGKTWSNYKKLVGTEELIAHAESVLQIRRTELVQTIQGGDPQLQGTWAIKTIALDAAAWASTPLRWWMLETALAKLEGRDDVHTPGSAWSLQTVADFGRSMILLAEEQQSQQLQLDTLTADMQEVKEEIKRSPLERVCHEYGCDLPCDWEIATSTNLPAKPGAYTMIDPVTKDILYIGETKNLRNRLWINRGKHEGLCFLWSKYFLYETRFILSFENEQQRKFQETKFTAAAEPRWQTSINQEDKQNQKKYRTSAPPLHNIQHSLYDAA